MTETEILQTTVTVLPDFINANTSTQSPGTPNPTVIAFQNLVPALVQCFSIILLGYIAGRSRIVCPTQARGLGHYVSYFALPAMLFKSLVELDFSEVNWLFFASILISKAIVFACVYIGTLLLGGTKALGKAGLFSMFATQSNDFALGYPIVDAIYSTTNPEIINYIFILAPINLLFLNPWGFLSLEVQKSSSSDGRKSKALVAWHVFKGLFSNPIFSTVFLGIIFNFALSQTLPAIVEDILTSLGSSFGATALFLLGISMVGKVKQQSGLALVPPALIIAAKILVLPLVTNQLVYVLSPGGSNQTLTDEYASFGFLYGSLPTAPTVFLYATYYQESVAMMAPAMVYCTFISAPFMFITASMVMIPMATEGQYHNALSDGAFDVSCIGLASAIWVFIIFVLRRKTSHFPHQFTANLIVAQALAAFGVILCHVITFNTYWGKIVHFIVMLIGVFGARCWTGMVALSLFVLRYRSTCFVIRHRFWFYLYGWGIPVMTVGILVAVIPWQNDDVDVLYEITNQQLIASIIILLLNIVMAIASLVALHRTDRFRRNEYQPLLGQDSEESESDSRDNVGLSNKQSVNKEGNTSEDSPTHVCNSNNSASTSSSSSTSSSTSSNGSCRLADIEDLPTLNAVIQRQMCSRRFGCSRYQTGECRRLLLRRNMKELSRQDEEDAVILNESERHQLGRHILLLYLLILSKIIAVTLCFWKLLGSSQSGIFLELSFLDCILNYGQGFLVLAIFGFDTENVIMPVVRIIRRCIYGTEKVHLPRKDSLSPEVMQTCDQFKTHHLASCRDVIVKDRKYHLRTYKNVFRGMDLVDWLLDVGLAEGRIEATNYATRLLIGRVLQHTHQEHHFHDNGLFYRFLLDEEEGGRGSGKEMNDNEEIDDDLMGDFPSAGISS